MRPRAGALWGLVAAGVLLLSGCGSTDPGGGHAVFASPQVDPIALSSDERELYVANTSNGTVSVVDTASRRVVTEIDVGLEPAGGQVIEEEQRRRALDEDVVDAVVDEIAPDGVVHARHERDPQLRADAVRACDQDRVADP